jgi:HEAT repeat protein
VTPVKRKWVVWGIVAAVVIAAALAIAERQHTLRTVRYLENLPSDDYEDAADAMDGLASRGAKVVPHLLTALDAQRDARLRWRAAEVLGRIGDRRAVEPLIALLKDEDAGVREAAAMALGRIRDPNAVQPLTAALEDEDPSVQVRAALALAEFGDESVIEPLRTLYQRSTPEAVAQAEKAKAEAEGKAQEPSAKEAQAQQEEAPPPDTRFEVREAVVRALGRLGSKASGAIEAVRSAVEDPHEVVRAAACQALGQLGAEGNTDLLIGRLSDVSPDVQTAAAWALAQSDDPAAADALKRAAEPGNPFWVRTAAVKGLQRRGIKAQ